MWMNSFTCVLSPSSWQHVQCLLCERSSEKRPDSHPLLECRSRARSKYFKEKGICLGVKETEVKLPCKHLGRPFRSLPCTRAASKIVCSVTSLVGGCSRLHCLPISSHPPAVHWFVSWIPCSEPAAWWCILGGCRWSFRGLDPVTHVRDQLEFWLLASAWRSSGSVGVWNGIINTSLSPLFSSPLCFCFCLSAFHISENRSLYS